MPAVLNLLGLGMRAGTVILGTGGVRAALRRDELALVIVAGDCSARTNQKVVRLARARGTPLIVGPSADSLGRSVGRKALQVIGVKDAQLAVGIRKQAAT